MGIYNNYLLPRLTDCACRRKTIGEQRARLAPLAQGEVLEVGIGSALNLEFYAAERVRRVIGLDPSAPLLALARRRAAGLPFRTSLLMGCAEAIALPDASVDTVVVTFTLCSIADVDAGLREMRRVLRPGGRFLFLEHGLAPDPGVRRWQHRLTPLWRRFAGGCHLNRDVPSLITRAGFAIEAVDSGYLPRAPRFAGYCFRGTAVPAAT